MNLKNLKYSSKIVEKCGKRSSFCWKLPKRSSFCSWFLRWNLWTNCELRQKLWTNYERDDSLDYHLIVKDYHLIVILLYYHSVIIILLLSFCYYNSITITLRWKLWTECEHVHNLFTLSTVGDFYKSFQHCGKFLVILLCWKFCTICTIQLPYFLRLYVQLKNGNVIVNLSNVQTNFIYTYLFNC